MRHLLPLTAAALLAACAERGESMGTTRAVPPATTTTTQLLGLNGELRGTATLTAAVEGTRVEARVQGMPPRGTHAIHIHTTGKCEPATKFESAGPHLNPTAKQHGRDNPAGPHQGDLPNLDIGADGSGSIDATIPGLTLMGGILDADGAAVLIHAGPDDYRSDPSGNSGGRIACGLVTAPPRG